MANKNKIYFSIPFVNQAKLRKFNKLLLKFM